LGLGIALLARRSGRGRGSPPALLWPWIALWALGAVLVPIALDRPAALAQALDRTAIGVLFLVLITCVPPTEEARRPIVLAGVWGLLVVACWGLLQRFGIHPFMDPKVWEPSRPTRPLGTHNLMGGYLAAWMPAALALALGASGGLRWLGAVAALVGFACFLQTESRGAWLAFLVATAGLGGVWIGRGGGHLLARGSTRDRRARRRMAIGLAAAAIVLGGISAGTLLSRLGTRERSGVLAGHRPTAIATPSAADGEASRVPPASALTSFERRRLVAATAVRLIQERPGFGWGPGSFRLAFYTARPKAMQRLEAETGETAVHAHSDPLELGAELGLAGLLCALLGLALAVPRIARRLDPRAEARAQAATSTSSPSPLGPLMNLALAIGATAIFLHSGIDFDLHEAPTALTAFVLFGLLWPLSSPVAPGPRAPSKAAGWVRGAIALVLLVAIGLTLLVARSDWAYRRAYRELAQGDVDRSAHWLGVALSGVPDQARVWIARGEVARHRARLRAPAAEHAVARSEAIECFARAAAIEPQIAARWQRLAIVMQEAVAADLPLGDPSSPETRAFGQRLAAAVDHAQATNPIDPLNTGLLDELATLARSSGPTSPRGLVASDLLEQIAAGEGWAAGNAARHLGDLALARGAAAEARSWYDKAQSAGENPELDLALGHLARLEGQLAVALGHYRRALAARPNAPEAYEGLRDVAVARGDSGEARRWEREAQRHVREGR
jgi:O-antigen ligase